MQQEIIRGDYDFICYHGSCGIQVSGEKEAHSNFFISKGKYSFSGDGLMRKRKCSILSPPVFRRIITKQKSNSCYSSKMAHINSETHKHTQNEKLIYAPSIVVTLMGKASRLRNVANSPSLDKHRKKVRSRFSSHHFSYGFFSFFFWSKVKSYIFILQGKKEREPHI